MAQIKGGFSFDGVDIADIGLLYAPEISNTYVYKPTNKKVHEQVFDAHPGGYYYGNTAQPKDFVLRCLFEEQHVLSGIMARVHDLFRVGRTGRLVFGKRPWLWYTATVINVNGDSITNRENGLITIQLRAYYPFARSDQYYADAEWPITPAMTEMQKEEAEEHNRIAADMLANSSMTHMPDNGTYDIYRTRDLEGLTCTYQFVPKPTVPLTVNKTGLKVINPGTERAPVCIEIGGQFGNGVTITNETNSEVCKFVGGSTDADRYLMCDALNGRVATHVVGYDTEEVDYLFHDYGFMYLEPSGVPIYRSNGENDVTLKLFTGSGTSSTFVLYANPVFEYREDLVGKYIYSETTGLMWRIIKVMTTYGSESGLFIQCEKNGRDNLLVNGISQWMIVKPNIISIRKTNDSTMSLNRLNFVFKPTFA